MIGIEEFANPEKFQEGLNITGADPAIMKNHLRKMLVIRKAEEKIAEKVGEGVVKCPCHLAIGQEAVAVAVAEVMRSTDRAFGAHRSHSHYLALNEDIDSLFAEVLGKVSGCSHGMGGSMHIIDKKSGFYGSVPIVGATIPIATGAGLAAKMDGRGDIAVSFFGDGACEEGVFHESLNMASSMGLPVLYVCENNMFSSHLHISLRQPRGNTSRFAEAHAIRHAVVDGNDSVSMTRTLTEAVAEMRATNRPYMLEAITYRWRGHVGHREDIDVGVQRMDDLAIWKKRDPVSRLYRSMREQGIVEEGHLQALTDDIQRKVEDAWRRAEEAEYPQEAALLDFVYER